MASDTQSIGTSGNRWRIAGWGIAVGLLLLPFLAMQLTSEVDWTASDFIFAGVLIGGFGLLFELTVKMSDNGAYRAGVALALVTSFLTIWVNGAVGMVGDEGNPLNLMFLGVILIALLSAALGRFSAGGMVRAMVVAAIAQLAASAAGMFMDLRGGLFSVTFAVLWLGAATMFQKSR